MSAAATSTRLLLFARTPVQGRVKTRLQPVLGKAGALALHQTLIEYCWKQLQAGGLGESELWISELGQESFFDNISAPGQRYLQQGENLGARMHHAVTDALQRGSTVLIVGADCPAVDAGYIRVALQWLQDGAEVVLGPAEDGGYVLVGMRATHEAMFRGIEWGTGRVLMQTRQRLRDAGLRWQELDTCWDVDRPKDLQRLAGLPIKLPIKLPIELPIELADRD